MEFKGYFIRAGANKLPSYLLAEEGYKTNPNIRSDLDSYTDGQGVLHRNILPHLRNKIWLKTNELTYSEKLIIQSVFPDRDVANVEFWNDETNSYQTGKFYIPDIDFVTKRLDKGGKQIYMPLEITLIEY